MIGKRIVSALFLLLFIITSCGKSSRDKNTKDDTAIRMGKEIKIEKIEYYDAKPDISADGRRLTFISGRESTLRVFTYDRDTKTPLSRLTDDATLTSETDAALSPDGKWVIFVASSSEGSNLYARAFDKSHKVVQLTNDVGFESQVSISSDSKLFSFATRTSSSSGSKIYVGMIDAASGPDAKSVVEITDSTNDDETQPTWLTADGSTNYTLVTINRDQVGFKDELRKRTITLGASITASTSTKISTVSDARAVRDVNFASTTSELIYVANNSGKDQLSPEKPTGSAIFDGKVNVSSRASKLTLSDGKTTFLDSFGSAETSVSMSKVDGNIGLWVSSVPAACEENKLLYSSALTLFDATAKVKASLLLINVAAKYASFTAKQSVCLSEKEAEDKAETDGYVISAKINDNAVKDNFSAVYVSVVTSDNEVYVYDRVNGVDSIVQISNNITK